MKLFYYISSFQNKKQVNYSKIIKYKELINSFNENRIIKNEITPLEIRRLVDYQVIYKLDYHKMDITKNLMQVIYQSQIQLIY